MADVIEINADTGEVIQRDFTADELAQQAADAAAAEQAAQQAADAAAERERVRAEARAHALTLGFTAEQVDLLYPQLAG